MLAKILWALGPAVLTVSTLSVLSRGTTSIDSESQALDPRGTEATDADQDSAAEPAPRGGPPRGEENPLVTGLRASPGCLGVETAFTSSGKTVIFAWFKDKDATIDWYWSDTHQHSMDQFITDSTDASFEPLSHVDDDVGPVLCIAALTPAKKGSVGGVDMPISQISIEMYTPLPGGIAVAGSFSPGKLEVPHMLRLPSMSGASPDSEKGKGGPPASSASADESK